MKYYDFILIAIPVALIGPPVPLLLTGAAPERAIFIGAAMSISLIVHALFINSPTNSANNSVENTIRPDSPFENNDDLEEAITQG